MSKPHTPKTTCHACGRQAAGGGQRFCWRCLFALLDRETYTPPPQRKRKPQQRKRA
jgi:predicted amidophosphoribosyltransferase